MNARAESLQEAASKTNKASDSTISALLRIMQSKEVINEEIKNRQKELAETTSQDHKIRIINDLTLLSNRLQSLKGDFEEIATGVDSELFAAPPKKRLDWAEEIQELLAPVIQELKAVTARPRAIERLRGEVAYYEKRAPVAIEALGNIEKLSRGVDDNVLKKELEGIREKWQNVAQKSSNQLEVVRFQLEEKLKEKKSFIVSLQNVMRLFFKSRGKNLIFSLLAFVVVFLFLRYLHRFIYRVSPAHKAEGRSYFIRLTDLIYYILTFASAVAAMVITLYIAGDWVLLAVLLIFLLGVVWAARLGLPRFWEQCKILLNIGTVRENERVVYNGIPWRIASLNLYTTLVNPELKGGMIRLPVRVLMDLHSRPFADDEPWFPCREKDWVILADGTRGKVVSQTPEMVQLVLLGGSHKTYGVEEFLKLNPDNISTDFRLSSTFGIDYRHQQESTSGIPERLKHEVVEGLTAGGYGDDIVNIRVEFKEAGTSSLDIGILADFSGRAAENYDLLGRLIQRIAVDACNKNGWTIPFTQITVHSGDPKG